MGRLTPAGGSNLQLSSFLPVGQAAGGGGLSEASLKAYEDMNQFLSAFIERVSYPALHTMSLQLLLLLHY